MKFETPQLIAQFNFIFTTKANIESKINLSYLFNFITEKCAVLSLTSEFPYNHIDHKDK